MNFKALHMADMVYDPHIKGRQRASTAEAYSMHQALDQGATKLL